MNLKKYWAHMLKSQRICCVRYLSCFTYAPRLSDGRFDDVYIQTCINGHLDIA